MNDDLRDIYNDAYSKGLEAGRREVLEDEISFLKWLYKVIGDDKIDYMYRIDQKIKDLTSDPQTPHSSSLARNTSEVQVAGDVGSNPTEESSSGGCGKLFTFSYDGRVTTCSKSRLCDECKQKQEKKHEM